MPIPDLGDFSSCSDGTSDIFVTGSAPGAGRPVLLVMGNADCRVAFGYQHLSVSSRGSAMDSSQPQHLPRPETITRFDRPHSRDPAGSGPAADPARETAGVEPQAASAQLAAQAAELAEHLQQRQELLDEQETRLNARAAELEAEERNLRRTLERDRFRERQELDRIRAALHDERERAASEQATTQAQLDDRRQQLLRREQICKQARADTAQVLRESLEVQLATERLWQEILASIDPAEAARRLSRIRQELADSYSGAKRELAERELRVEESSRRLESHLAALRERKSELETWLAHRQSDIERQAAHLLAREAELESERLRLARLHRAEVA